MALPLEKMKKNIGHVNTLSLGYYRERLCFKHLPVVLLTPNLQCFFPETPRLEREMNLPELPRRGLFAVH
jgi:hypothetical protein